MADFPSDEELGSFLDEYEQSEQQGQEAVAAAERDDQRAAKQAQAKKAERQDDAVVTKAEYMTDRFLAGASETEKRLFSIYAHGASEPEQIRAAIELAQTNAAEAAKVTTAEVSEQAEKKAEEIAAEQYGVGPLSNAGPAPKPDQDKEDIERISQGGPNLARNLAESIFRDDPVLGPLLQR